MTVRDVLAPGLLAAMVLVTLPLSCAAQRPGSDSWDDQNSAVEWGDGVTPEELIRERDMMSLESFQELQQEMDDQHRALEEGFILEEGLEEDPEAVEPEPATFRERMAYTLEKAGLVTWAVFTVAFSLGMAALPFLI